MSTESAPAVSPQIMESVEAGNAVDLVLAPAFAVAQLYTATAHALGLQALGLQSAQQNAAITTNAVTAAACSQVLAVGVAVLPKTS